MVQLAGELFAQKGYRATTVREIADAAGILSGSLYHHFDSKESIGDEILSGFINDVLADYRSAVSSGGSPRAVLEQIVRSTSQTLARHRAALAMLPGWAAPDWARRLASTTRRCRRRPRCNPRCVPSGPRRGMVLLGRTMRRARPCSDSTPRPEAKQEHVLVEPG